MIRIRFLLLLLLPLLSVRLSFAQIGYSPVVDSLLQELSLDSLLLFNRQLTGDTAVMISGEPQVIESRHAAYPGNALAAQFIFEKFQSCGLDTRFQNYSDSGQNVIAEITGTVHPDRILILCAHYDNMPPTPLAPGSDDNASGVCALLEAARLASGLEFPFTLQLIAFDEEEVGFLGSTAYVDSAYFNIQNIVGALNLDMIAWDSNDDGEVSVAVNDASMSLMKDLFQSIRLYQPELSPHLLINFGGSDHYRFWGRQYESIMLEEDRKDFNSYYHTVNDHVSQINLEYFYRMTRAALATFFSMAWDFRMQLAHEPLVSTPMIGTRTVTLTLDPVYSADTVLQLPRLHYSVDDQAFEFLTPEYISQGQCSYLMPAFPYGSKVSYYFSVTDSAQRYICTLPPAGLGMVPAASVPPEYLYTFYVLDDTVVTCHAGSLPLTIPVNDTLVIGLTVPQPGRILDVDAGLSLSHTRVWDLDIWLESPEGQLSELSTDNGFTLDHHISTVFDDEATAYIQEGKPPFTGSFKPEGPLSVFDDGSPAGLWKLKVINQATTTGKVNAFSLTFRLSTGDIYVDAGVSQSGDGLTWQTALQTISEACASNPGPGTAILIRSGEYNEQPVISSNGQVIVPLTTSMGVIAPDVIQFPAGTDLSEINLEDHPGEYFAYLYRSKIKNSGVYQVVAVDDASDQLVVSGAAFIEGFGRPGDTTALSCCIARPVVYMAYPAPQDSGGVVINIQSSPALPAALLIGQPDTAGAGPANFNLVDGIDITGVSEGSGVLIRNSSFNYLKNCRLSGIQGNGVTITGNDDFPASYNIVANSRFIDVSPVSLCLGTPGMPRSINHVDFNHVVDNLFTNGEMSYTSKAAIVVCSGTVGNVVRDNLIHDYLLTADTASALEIQPGANYTLVSCNRFRNIHLASPGLHSVIRTGSDTYKIDIFNNILSDSLSGNDGLYSFWIDCSGTDSCRVVHNTIYQVSHGFMLEDHTTISDFDIQNNIIEIPGEYFTHVGTPGRYHIAYNLYATNPVPDPGMPYFDEEGRQVGTVAFKDVQNGDFNLVVNSDKAICNGAPVSPMVQVDPERNFRYLEAPDIGAYELDDKKVWLGTVSSSWTDERNWSGNSLPDSTSNIVILESPHDPVLPSGWFTVGGILVEEGTTLRITAGSGIILQNP